MVFCCLSGTHSAPPSLFPVLPYDPDELQRRVCRLVCDASHLLRRAPIQPGSDRRCRLQAALPTHDCNRFSGHLVMPTSRPTPSLSSILSYCSRNSGVVFHITS
jgi:hypothetical protein